MRSLTTLGEAGYRTLFCTRTRRFLDKQGFTPSGSVSEIDSIKLMVWHLDALYTRDDRGRMTAVNEAGGGPAPRFFLGRTQQGDVWSVRQDQPEELTRALAAALEAPEAPLTEVERLLEELAPIEHRWEGPAFVVPSGEANQSVVRITAANSHLLEPLLSSWIPTHPASRGMGHAGLVVARWAVAVRETGATPLYSTSFENAASLRVAEKLKLEQFGTDFHLT